MPDLPSKSAVFVIHMIEKLQRANGEGISVRVDGKPIDRIEFADGFIEIRTRPD